MIEQKEYEVVLDRFKHAAMRGGEALTKVLKHLDDCDIMPAEIPIKFGPGKGKVTAVPDFILGEAEDEIGQSMGSSARY